MIYGQAFKVINSDTSLSNPLINSEKHFLLSSGTEKIGPHLLIARGRWNASNCFFQSFGRQRRRRRQRRQTTKVDGV